MEIALRLKFTQYPDLKTLLLGTGDADLVEVRRVPSLLPRPGISSCLGLST